MGEPAAALPVKLETETSNEQGRSFCGGACTRPIGCIEPAGTRYEGSRASLRREKRRACRSERACRSSERTDDLSQTAVRDRVAQAIETIEDACAADIDDFCGKVTSGGGRVSLCMLAHEDRLSSGCRSALYRVSRELKRNVDRVAEVCWNEIQTLCGDTGKIGQCLAQKRGSLSSSCQTIVGALGQRVHRLMSLVGDAGLQFR